MRGKPTSLLECSSKQHLAALLDLNVDKLNYFAYGTGKKYQTFDIPKKSGGVREIAAPVDALISIQRKLAAEFSKVYPRPSYVQGFIEGGSIVNNATIHLKKRMVLNIDLHDFFGSITAGRIIGLLRKKPFNFPTDVASTIAGLVCYNGKLPQGAPTSPVLSNMICLRMDRELCALSKKYRATYSRYADDITLSTIRRDFHTNIVESYDGERNVKLGKELISLINSNLFEINPLKTRLQYGSIPKYVTGVKVNANPNLPRNYVRQLRSMLHAWEKFDLNHAQDHFTDKFEGGNRVFIQVVRGRLAHLKNVKGEDDPVYARLYNRYVRAEGKGRPEIPESEIDELFGKVFVVKSGSGSQGTGFVLDKKWFITCDHVLNGDEISYFPYQDWALPNPKTVRVHQNWRSPIGKFDLLAIPLEGFDKTNIAKSFTSAPVDYKIAINDTCRVVGFPAYLEGDTPMHTPMFITGFRKDKYQVPTVHVSNKMVRGSSGSPVINNKRQVIGIVRTGAANWKSGEDSVGYTFLPIDQIRMFLDTLSV